MDKESTLLYLTGQINNPFFINEIPDFVESFSHVLVVAYDEKNPKKADELALKYGFEYKLLKRNVCIQDFPTFIKLMKSKHTREELKFIGFGRKGIKKIAYIALYNLNATKTYRAIKGKNLQGQIYIYSFWLTRAGYAAAVLKKLIHPQIVVSRAHGYDVYEERNDMNYLPFRKFVAKNVDKIAFISNDGYRYFADLCKKNAFVHNELMVIRLGSRKPKDLMKKGSCRSSILTIASCSSIIPLKRLDLIIKVISRINALGTECRWLHIGDGEDKAGIKALAEREIPGKYRLLGQIDNSEIFEIYKKYNVDFFINMSDTEGVPVSIMEAISVGIPAVARDVGGIAEIITSESGILCDALVSDNMITECAKRIIDLYYDKDNYQLLSKKAIEYWQSTYDLKKNNTSLIKEICSDSFQYDARHNSDNNI